MTVIDSQLLAAAVQAAAFRRAGAADLPDLMADTWAIYRSLTNPTSQVNVTVTITRGSRVIQTAVFNNVTEENFMTAMTMDDTATITVQTEDDHGDPTADQLSWAQSDGGANVTLTVSEDTKTCTVTPVAEGTGVEVSASDPSAPNVAAFVASFDIGPGPTSQLAGTVTVNTGANTPAPPAGP